MKSGVFLSIIILLFFIGCSSKPSESDAMKIVQNNIKIEHSEKLIQIVSVEKTNGQDIEVMGAQVYKMKVKITIKFLLKCNWDQLGGYRAFQSGNNGDLNPGDTRTFEDIFDFTKTENGWLGTDGQIY